MDNGGLGIDDKIEKCMDIVKNLIMDEVRKDMAKHKMEHQKLQDEHAALKESKFENWVDRFQVEKK